MQYKTILGQYDENTSRPEVKEIKYLVKGEEVDKYNEYGFLTPHLKIRIVFSCSDFSVNALG